MSIPSGGIEPKACISGSPTIWQDSACLDGATSSRHSSKINLGIRRCQASQRQIWYFSEQVTGQSSANVQRKLFAKRCEVSSAFALFQMGTPGSRKLMQDTAKTHQTDGRDASAVGGTTASRAPNIFNTILIAGAEFSKLLKIFALVRYSPFGFATRTTAPTEISNKRRAGLCLSCATVRKVNVFRRSTSSLNMVGISWDRVCGLDVSGTTAGVLYSVTWFLILWMAVFPPLAQVQGWTASGNMYCRNVVLLRCA